MEAPKTKLLQLMADRYHVDPDTFKDTVLKMCMPKDATIEEFALFMLVAHEHDLNPMTREIFAIRKSEKNGGGIQPVVSVDGWVKIIQRKTQLDGFEFSIEWTDKAKSIPFSCTCEMWRKDQAKPTVVTEYFSECKRERDGSPWFSMPCRMIRHKALIQCARYAFGFAGIMDEDEAETIRRVEGREIVEPEDRTESVKRQLRQTAPALPESTGDKLEPVKEKEAVRSGGAAKVQKVKAPSESTPAATVVPTTATAAPAQKTSGGTATPEAATNNQQAANKSRESVQTPATGTDTGEVFKDTIRVTMTLDMPMNETKFIDDHENAFYCKNALVSTQMKEMIAKKLRIEIEWTMVKGKAMILDCKAAE